MSSLYKVENERKYVVTGVPSAPLLESLGVFEGATLIKKTTYSGGLLFICLSY